MENNEMMEVNTEMTEVCNSTESGNMDILTGALIGGAVVGGIWILKKVVTPAVSFVMMKINAAKEKKAQEAKEHDFVNAEFQEEDPEK